MRTGYLDELAERLRGADIPPEKVAGMVADLAAHLDDTCTDPHAEFGPVDEFAEQLVTAPSHEDGAENGPEDHTIRWSVDIFAETETLDRFGSEGWEIDRIDPLGRFVGHRAPEQSLQWEYRREVTVGRGRVLGEMLAPDGWEPCGTWVCFAYFKRPTSAGTGPAAEIGSPPDAPQRRVFFSRRFYVLVSVCVVVMLVAGVRTLLVSGMSSGTGFFGGAAFGAAAVLFAAGAAAWAGNRPRRS